MERWTRKTTGAIFDFTNSESPQDGNDIAYEQVGVVTKSATFSCRFVYDKDNPPTASPPNLQTGVTLTNVKVYTHEPSNKFWTFTSLVVVSDGEEMQIKDKLMVDVELRATGPWSAPS